MGFDIEGFKDFLFDVEGDLEDIGEQYFPAELDGAKTAVVKAADAVRTARKAVEQFEAIQRVDDEPSAVLETGDSRTVVWSDELLAEANAAVEKADRNSPSVSEEKEEA